MTYSLVAIPIQEDLILLNNLRNYIYQNDFRFKNKQLGSDTHITLTSLVMNEVQIDGLKQLLEKNVERMKPFTLTNKDWELTKENKEPNYKIDRPYTWIALKFPKLKSLYELLDTLTKELGVNNSGEYIKKVMEIESTGKDGEYIANHINLSNYTRIERADECWDYFNQKLPKRVTFNRLALRDEKGNILFTLTMK